ncbi:MAG: septal ring lytic transglycosylase RlpA family protein [Solirubrobacteraceae bacterium]
MRIALKTYPILLVLFAVTACVAGSAATALASTGGTSGGSAAPAAAPGATPATSIHTTGIATWFGPGFYGKQTACGQTLTPGVVGVANRTLPCGTLVKVTYRGHSLTVPVLDRGPYSHGADWDLTAGAAEALGVTETVRIGTRIVGKTANTPVLGLPPGSSSATAAGGALAAEP